MTRKNLEVSNFTLKFGEKNLLDLAEEIVIPAFLDNRIRNFRSVDYFFLETSLIEIVDESEGVPLACIVGRFVKNTLLRREQIYNKPTNLLIKDHSSIQSSPSALFVLILNNHRLLYLEETSFAPPVSAFKVTIEQFLFESHANFLEQLYRSGSNQQEAREEYPAPNLKIIPLSNTANLSQFVEKYKKLKSIEVKIYSTNSSSNNNQFFDDMKKEKTQVGSSITTLRHENKSNGLNKDEAIIQLEGVVGQANSHIKLYGEDKDGNTISGSNDDIKIKVPLDKVPSSVDEAAIIMADKYKKTIKDGLLSEANILDPVEDTVRVLLDRHVRNIGNESH
jgi:hypothetical protein